MKEYVKAKDLVSKIQTRYKSEYQRQFINWNQPISEIKKQLLNNMPAETALKKLTKYTHLNAAGISSGKPTSKTRSNLMTVKLPIPLATRDNRDQNNGVPVDSIHAQSIYAGLK